MMKDMYKKNDVQRYARSSVESTLRRFFSFICVCGFRFASSSGQGMSAAIDRPSPVFPLRLENVRFCDFSNFSISKISISRFSIFEFCARHARHLSWHGRQRSSRSCPKYFLSTLCIESEITREERYQDRMKTTEELRYQQSMALLREQRTHVMR